MTALYIICGILALFLVLDFIPIKAQIRLSYNDTYGEVIFKYLFIRKKRNLLKEKNTAKKSAGEDTVEHAKKNGKRNSGSYISLTKGFVHEIKDGIISFFGYILKHAVTVYELNINAVFGFEDAMYTGMSVGGAYAASYGIIGLLEDRGRLKKYNVNIIPSFEQDALSAGVYCEIGTSLLHIFVLVAIALKTVIKIFFKAWRMRKR